MAANRVHANARQIKAICTYPATPASGDPVLIGQIPGVALTAEATDGTTVVDTGGSYTLYVQGSAASGATGSAVAAGDIIYYVDGHTGAVLCKQAIGVRFGYALGAVVDGATTAIEVKLGY
jgi:predicted RecA/RadA family phage recombinase